MQAFRLTIVYLFIISFALCKAQVDKNGNAMKCKSGLICKKAAGPMVIIADLALDRNRAAVAASCDHQEYLNIHIIDVSGFTFSKVSIDYEATIHAYITRTTNPKEAYVNKIRFSVSRSSHELEPNSLVCISARPYVEKKPTDPDWDMSFLAKPRYLPNGDPDPSDECVCAGDPKTTE